MFEYFTRSYQRKKRIQRILSLREGYDGYRPRRLRESDNFLFPRYTWIRFFMTLAAMFVMGGTISYILNSLFGSAMSIRARTIIVTPFAMAVGFVAVEIVDSFFLRWEKAFDDFRKSVAPLLMLFVLAFGYILIKNPEAFTKPLLDWRTKVNEEIQVKPLAIIVMPSQGLNWRLLYESPNHLKKSTYSEASEFCKSLGRDWQVYDGDKSFRASPNPKFDRTFSVWTNLVAGQIGPSGIQAPIAFSSTTLADRLVVLCINKRIGP